MGYCLQEDAAKADQTAAGWAPVANAESSSVAATATLVQRETILQRWAVALGLEASRQAIAAEDLERQAKQVYHAPII